MGYTRRYISFDLGTDRTRECLANANYSDNTSKAYEDIRKYMERNGFVHDQKSTYISEKPMPKAKATEIIAHLTDEIPYLKGAFRKVRNLPANQEEYADLVNSGLSSFDDDVKEANSIVKEVIKENTDENKKEDTHEDDSGFEL